MKNKKKSDDLKLGFLERKLYDKLYSTLEKSLKVCYQIYYDVCKNYGYEHQEILSFDEFCELVNNKLKGE